MNVNRVTEGVTYGWNTIKLGAQWLKHKVIIILKESFNKAEKFGNNILLAARNLWDVSQPLFTAAVRVISSPLGIASITTFLSIATLKKSYELDSKLAKIAAAVFSLSCATFTGIILAQSGMMILV